MIRSRTHRFSTLTLTTVALASVAIAGHVRAAAAAAPQRQSSSMTTVRDSALGVAFDLPAGWTRDQTPAHVLEFAGFPPSGARYSVVRLSITSWGTTFDQDDARVAAAGMDSLLEGATPASRVVVSYAGAPGVQATGVLGPGPVTAIILAHAGAVYKILAPGAALGPDQLAALRSLRFIPRFGLFPAANGTGVPSTTAPALTVTTTTLTTGLAVRVRGAGFGAGARVTLRAMWTGVPRSGQYPRYTSYMATQFARADRVGALDATLDIPVDPSAYADYHVRVMATDATTGGKAAAAPSAESVILRISPVRITLGQPFTLTLTGALPDADINFTERPLHSTGFGGGIMGSYRADGHGRVEFTSPAFIQKDELGSWIVTASQRAGVIASTIITVMTS